MSVTYIEMENIQRLQKVKEKWTTHISFHFSESVIALYIFPAPNSKECLDITSRHKQHTIAVGDVHIVGKPATHRGSRAYLGFDYAGNFDEK